MMWPYLLGGLVFSIASLNIVNETRLCILKLEVYVGEEYNDLYYSYYTAFVYGCINIFTHQVLHYHGNTVKR